MSIPENALIMRNDSFGTESVAYRDWADLRRDFMATFDDMTPEELDDLEAQPENESEIYEADLVKQESENRGVYIVTSWHNVGYGRMEERTEYYRIYWNYEGTTTGRPDYIGDEFEEED